MKIRVGYVSNSSSSSFILIGKDIKNKFTKYLCNDKTYKVKEYDEEDDYKVNRIFQSLLDEIKNYNTEDKIIEFISDKIENMCSDYYNNNNKKSSIFIHSDRQFEKLCKEFNIIEQLKKDLDNKREIDLAIYGHSMYFSLYSESKNKLDQIILEKINILAKIIYKKIKDQNNEIYVVNYGNDGSAEDTAYSCMIEYDFLGNNGILNYIDDITVLHISEH